MNPFTPLTLPNGSQLINRLAKAAMEENMADYDHAPSEALIQLYRTWAEGGAGLLITGNVMVDGHAMTGPGGVVLDSHDLSPELAERFSAWAEAAKSGAPRSGCRSTTPVARCRRRWGSPPWPLPPYPWRSAVSRGSSLRPEP
ncbi:hypothetical protein ACSZNU_05920 [Aeromonas hydrophila]